MEVLSSAIIGHFVGDFLLQTDRMAIDKKYNSLICFLHCLIWTTSVCLFANWFNPYYIGFLFISHYMIDRTNFIIYWMTLMDQEKFGSPPFAPWSLVVIDNILHILSIYSIYRYDIWF